MQNSQPALIAAFPHSAAMPLPPAGTAVGRDWLASYELTDSEVSREHLLIERRGSQLQIRDCGSTNGTWLDGEPLERRRDYPLVDGSVLRLGRTLLVYRQALAGPLRPSQPLAGLVGPFGLRTLADSLAGIVRQGVVNVLIIGETGTGKEFTARHVAACFDRSEPYAAVNAAGVAASVFESQLFGHVAGAFSDAKQASPGIVLGHQGGTVFLDEIGELPLALQAKLLRLLENREVFPVGAVRPTKADVLLVAATNRALAEMVETGQFRRDLHARLAAAELKLPPLRERVEDLFAIARAIMPRWNIDLAPESGRVEVEAVERLMLESWPSNVRELAATIRKSIALDPEGCLSQWSVEKILGPRPSLRPRQLTATQVAEVLAATGGNKQQAAQRLGVTRAKLRRFLDKQKSQ